MRAFILFLSLLASSYSAANDYYYENDGYAYFYYKECTRVEEHVGATCLVFVTNVVRYKGCSRIDPHNDEDCYEHAFREGIIDELAGTPLRHLVTSRTEVVRGANSHDDRAEVEQERREQIREWKNSKFSHKILYRDF